MRPELQQAEQHMTKSLQVLSSSLTGMHSGGVSIALLETVKVPYYGQLVPLRTIASITGKGNQLHVNLYDPSEMRQVEASLKTQGFNAGAFSKQQIVVSVPQMSGEEIQKTVAHIKKLGEEAKIAIRNIRKNEKDKIKSLSVSEDVKKLLDRDLQILTDKHVGLIDDLVGNKSKQLSPGQ